ncbi:GNAT family N-acetyltransferase [Desertibacillus haloalkaliphilus]|uniref:GNAT family N-acetyltransferase n=1 Tax=Desertibacillus haloalkaliphilus TaxID=1328930 RepID=UPI001C26071F|nr:GNAT family N-acetyltransferase [Desertibacillus haloalkaliphilus]MBU8908007.1 GNAT family N-acetyltransferase [Desertibacillus haloalkaliphilus]
MNIINITSEVECKQAYNVEKSSYRDDIAASMDAFSYRFEHFRDFFFIAKDRGEVIGVTNGVRTAEPNVADDRMKGEGGEPARDGDYFVILTVAVKPSERRKQIGSKLVQHVISEARKHQLKGILLMCEKHLIEFYGALGFTYMKPSSSSHGGVHWHEMQYQLQ